uniref:Uncharacterized protein LOC100187442 n=1 Tax=Phallusia mammillata TaxID=59560 RepID=A0A6F9DJI5_9ASCI|nr:uncharacterized protein LOC100187442 [Phallusia mammillata]
MMKSMKWYESCHTQEEAYRQLVTMIATKISSLEELKFQCKDFIGRGRLEKVETALALFELLEERDLASPEDVNFLWKILTNIRRKDLARMVNQYVQIWLNIQPGNNPYSHSQYKMEGIKHVTPDGTGGIHSKAFSGFTNSSQDKRFIDHQPVYAVPFMAVDNTEIPQEFVPQRFTPQESFEMQHEDMTSPIPQPLRMLIEYLGDRLTLNWQTVMRNLDIPERVINAAMMNWSHNIRQQIKESLEYWARNGSERSVDAMIIALRRSGRNDLGDMVTNLFVGERRSMTQ